VQANLKQLAQSTSRGRPVRTHEVEVKSIAEWHELNYLRIRTQFIYDVLAADDNLHHLTLGGLQTKINSDLRTLLDDARHFSGEEVEITDPRYVRIMAVLHAARRAPADFKWTEGDLFRAAYLAYAQCMLLDPDDAKYVVSISNRIFAHMHSLLLPPTGATSPVFCNAGYRERARGLLISFLLMIETMHQISH
jgi:hypothetical protein